MDAISVLRENLQESHELLEGTVEGVGDEATHWAPPGAANPLGATYAHVVVSEDMVVNGMLGGRSPMAMGSWAGRTGLSELPPSDADWGAWARRVRVDLAALRQYAHAVYAASDEYLRSLSPDALSLSVDLSARGLGQRSLAWLIRGVALNAYVHGGEISCLKGLQGLRGYPVEPS